MTDWYSIVAIPAPGSAGSAAALKPGVSVVIGLILLNYFAPGELTFLERLFASAMLASIALPLWLWMSGAERSIPFMTFLTLIFAYYFALPVFLLRRFAVGIFKPTTPPEFITLALGYSLLGLYCIFAGYYGPMRWLFAPIIPRLNLQWRNERAVRLVALILGFGGLFLSSSRVLSALPESLAEIGSFATDLSMIGICTLIALQCAGRLDRIASIFVWVFLIPARIAIGVGTGASASGLMVGVAVAFMFASVRRRIPWKMLAIGTVALFIIRPAQVPYRVLTWGHGRMADAGVIEKIKLLYDICYRLTFSSAVPMDKMVEFAGMRLAQFTVFAEVIGDTPRVVPYWDGATYRPLPFKPIPRFLMPDKPEEDSGQTFGHRYGFISNENINTSINLPQIVELYANFGLLGVIIGSFLFGVAYRIVIDMYVHPGMGLGALVGAVYLSGKLLEVGSAASLVVGKIPWGIVLIGLIHLVMEIFEMEAAALGLPTTSSRLRPWLHVK